jgi:hypothetical protein
MSFTSLVDPVWDATCDELAEIQRGRGREFARESRLLARLEAKTTRGDWQAEEPYDSLVMEVAGTCLIGQNAAAARIEAAVQLVRNLPVLLDELDAGRVLLPQARVLIEETKPCTPEVCAEVESRIMAEAATLLPGVLRRRVRALILAVDADEAARRAAKAAADRKVWSRPIEDGQALLIAKGPAVQIHALELRLTAEARAVKKDGDPRPLDQIRFDLLCAHQTGGLAVTPLQALLLVPVATALGISDEPGVLDGYGPLPAPLVRELLTDAELRKVCVDARTGRVVAAERRTVPPTGSPDALRRALLTMVDTATTIDLTPEPQHDPSTALARDVRLRDRQCDGPGCSVHAGQCELDHHVPYPDGPTSFTNLRPRSQRCHHAKHHGWTVTIDPDGTSHWTSPHGRTYTVPTRDRPPPTIPAGTRLPSPARLAAHDRNLLTPSPDASCDDPWAETDDPDPPEVDVDGNLPWAENDDPDVPEADAA